MGSDIGSGRSQTSRGAPISTRRRPPARPTGAPSPAAGTAGEVPAVGGREACPCGSGKRYKACHGRVAAPFVARPFAGLVDETEWVALREVVPAASAPLRVLGHEDREVQLWTVLPLGVPVEVREDGRVLLGLQSSVPSEDLSRDLAATLLRALDATPGPRLQDVLAPEPLQVTVHEGFDRWLDGLPEPAPEVLASLERANSSAVPTARLQAVHAAYWCRMRERAHLRWVLPEQEEPLLDALARLSVAGGLGLGEDTRFLGTFRAYGLLVPVWDLPPAMEADGVEEPAALLRTRLDEALATPRPLTGEERRARSGLLSRQLTLR